MAPDTQSTPGLASFRALLPSWPVDKSTEYLISLLRRRQIQGSRSCALATAWLLRKVVSTTRATEFQTFINRVQQVGKKLIEAAPRELAVGNVVRRVLGAIREEEDNRTTDTPVSSEIGSLPPTPAGELASMNIPSTDLSSTRPTLLSTHTGGIERRPPVTSMFSIMSHPTMRTPGTASPLRSGTSTPQHPAQQQTTDFRAEVLEAITEIVDELDQAEEQVASYALEQVTPQETIFTHSSSSTVQRFLLKAASRRKFTVINAEAYPNGQRKTHAMATGNKSGDEELDSESFQKPLIAAGITVIVVPDSAIFALMSRATKVILSARGVFSNGSIIAEAGCSSLVRAARFHHVPIIALAATYKLSPLYPYDPYEFIEYGDVAKVVPYQDRELHLGLDRVRNPLTDFIEADNIDLFVTNLGGCATAYLYRLVKDQYRDDDFVV